MKFTLGQNHRLPDKLAHLVIAGLLIFLVGACASSPAAPDRGAGPGMAVVPAEKTGLFTSSLADAVMLNEGIARLGMTDKPADYAKARETFAAMTKDYPKSKWRPLAETFISVIDAIQSLQDLAKKLQQDNERLKKDIQALNNRLQAERANLVQENETLKKDMELLKKLEVQLDQREKMLR